MKTVLDVLDVVIHTLPLANFVYVDDFFTVRTCLHMYNISAQMIMKGGY